MGEDPPGYKGSGFQKVLATPLVNRLVFQPPSTRKKKKFVELGFGGYLQNKNII